MMQVEAKHSGGCVCGAARFTASGAPLRSSLCHCLDCRKSHGASFVAFAIYDPAMVDLTGETRAWITATGYARHFCPICGSPIYAIEADGREIELYAGSFDETNLFAPSYELWTVRREEWLGEMPTLTEHYAHDRDA